MLHPGGGGGGASEPLGTSLVSGNYFSLLGVSPAAGRLFSDADDAPLGAHPEVVLSYGYWVRRFNADPRAIGSTMRIGDRVFTVIGVAAPEFFGVVVGQSIDAWLPLSMVSTVPPYFTFHGVMDQCLHVIARLQPNVSIEQATAAEKIRMHQLIAAYAKPTPGSFDATQLDHMEFELTSAGSGLSQLRRSFSAPLRILMVVVGLVLLIACANVANLLLARATARQREMAVRFAVGSGRWRIVRQLLTESLVLSCAGGIAGVLLASWGSKILLWMVASGPEPVPLNVGPDLRVLGFTLGISLLTGILFGIAPAFRASSVDPNSGLREGRSGTATRGRMFSSRALVVAQVALSLLLLVGAGLFIHSFRNLENIQTGFHRDGLLLFSVGTESSGLKEDIGLAGLYQGIEDHVAAIPGVSHSAFAMFTFNQGEWTTNISVEGHPDVAASHKETGMNITDSSYLAATGIPLVTGRYFTERDTATSPKVAVINEKLAHDLFGAESPIGKHMGTGDSKGLDTEIVGVVRNAKYQNLREDTPWMGYVPLTQHPQYLGNLLVSFHGDAASVIRGVRGAVAETNANVPISEVTGMGEQVDRSIHSQLLVAQLSAFFGALALLLAAIGLYGVLSYSVARRTNEIGLRMALGAQSTGVLWMILREVWVLVGLGIAVGVPVALVTSHFIESQLYGMHSLDFVTLFAAILVLTLIGSMAGLLPARRAARVEPTVALRYE